MAHQTWLASAIRDSTVPLANTPTPLIKISAELAGGATTTLVAGIIATRDLMTSSD